MDFSNLISKIECAFDGVPSGRIGIREASAMDDRASESELTKAREKDVETDWRTRWIS